MLLGGIEEKKKKKKGKKVSTNSFQVLIVAKNIAFRIDLIFMQLPSTSFIYEFLIMMFGWGRHQSNTKKVATLIQYLVLLGTNTTGLPLLLFLCISTGFTSLLYNPYNMYELCMVSKKECTSER